MRLLFVVFILHHGHAFLMDGEGDVACQTLVQTNITLQALIEHEQRLCESVSNHFQNHNAELLMHKDSILHLIQDNTYLKQTVQQQTTAISDLTARLDSLEKEAAGNKNVSVVAFSTLLMHNLGVVKEGTTIVFDHVAINTGNGYDVNSGTFVAPVSGAYHFSMSMASPSIAHFFLMKNGQNVEYTFSGGDGTWETTSVSAVMELLKGDRVWVEADGAIYGYANYQRPGHADHLYLHTGFMGFMIH